MKLSSMAILLVAVGAMMIPAMPSAMAMPDASIGGSSTVSDGTSTITITVGAATSALDVEGERIRVYDDSKGNVGTTGASCPLPDPSATDAGVVTTWELRSSADEDDVIDFIFPVGSSSTTGLTVPFGTGVNPVTVNIDAPGELSIGGVDQGAGVSVSAVWKEVTDNIGGTGTTAPDTSRLGFYGIYSCGDEFSGQNQFEIDGNFLVQLPVGGTILPVSMSSLLIAGLSMNSMWMLPLMGAAVGVVALFKVKRKQN